MTDKCIEWTGYKNKDGYGRKRVGSKLYLVHRLAYCEHHNVDISHIDGLLIRHKCDNPSCINPLHLEPGSQKDNMQDMKSRGRGVPRAKLSPAQVIEIRSKHRRNSNEFCSSALAKHYGVSKVQINRILARTTWPDL
ncbi:hypothetical protein GC087_07100 [Pantoea sp. JZ2]|uniref:hypothetical protein n=1 Tax=Pantoea sp. JZ2 TaxID=2654189 RepID=UPI002B49EC01|nr:hypothetical protein [Pantoea sp. JZ2]WRH12402.1 hypothetical protein GC087_07100 [Pantoea sp. JZ2]